MSRKERVVLVSILILVLLLVTADVVGDSIEGVDFWHLFIEGGIGVSTLFAIFYILKDSFRMKKNLIETNKQFSTSKIEAEKWKADSRKFLDGLSSAIDGQLNNWKLTMAEKEVAFLLLKGLSLKEVADVRNTTEKTARTQSIAIYAKSGLSGRSELSAFFLEDLLVPQVNTLKF